MNLLLVEYNFFHDEVLIPQIDWIYDEIQNDNKINLFVIMNKDIIKRETLALSIYDDIAEKVNFKLIKKRYDRKWKPLNYLYIFETLFYIYRNKIDIIVFNTIDMYNDDVEFLIHLLPKNIKKIGILHDGSLFKKYNTKYDKVFVLSELVSKFFIPKKIEYIYTLLYKYKHKPIFTHKAGLTICIPGNIENKRRDYPFIIEFVKDNKRFCDTNHIKFIFLGNINTKDGVTLKSNIYDNNLQQYFQLFFEFIPYDEFMNYILISDMIIPLIHKNIQDFTAYKTYKISDSFNMAFSCNKPLLMHNIFQKDDEFNKFSFFYTDNVSLKETLIAVLSDKTLLKDKETSLNNAKKFDYAYQKSKYLQLLIS